MTSVDPTETPESLLARLDVVDPTRAKLRLSPGQICVWVRR
jgi:hypothetical protein